MSERVIVAHLGYHQPVADVVRPAWNSSFFSCSKISGSKYRTPALRPARPSSLELRYIRHFAERS